jgi:hypothetical protein
MAATLPRRKRWAAETHDALAHSSALLNRCRSKVWKGPITRPPEAHEGRTGCDGKLCRNDLRQARFR